MLKTETKYDPILALRITAHRFVHIAQRYLLTSTSSISGES